jgi:pimeloyl-ACP methyl ester carboxylesterase
MMMRRSWIALGLAATFAACVALAWRPIQRAGASAIVVAPNRGKPAPSPLSTELRVEVGPPQASLSLELVDPASPAPQGTVFVLHGIRDTKASMRGWGRMLAASGLRAVLVDLRGHGRSTGDWLSYGVVESRDLTQALDALTARGLVVPPVGAMGISYGAATAIEWAGIDPRVAAVVAVAPFASLRAVVPGYVPVQLPPSFLNGAVDLAGALGGFDPDDASPATAITRTRASVLLIHGDADARIPFWHSEVIAAAGRGHAELVIVKGAGHNSIPSDPDGTIARRAPAWFLNALH